MLSRNPGPSARWTSIALAMIASVSPPCWNLFSTAESYPTTPDLATDMTLTNKHDLGGVDWDALALVYERAPLGKRDPVKLRRAFEASYLTTLVLDGARIVGAGRAISDGEYYSNVYDVA